MKKLFALFFVAGMFTLASCDNQQGTRSADERVISRDTTSIETEVEVEETVVEYDTTTNTETRTRERDLETGETETDGNRGL
jgi:lipoprotein NlpI